jgi:hypothetical protein
VRPRGGMKNYLEKWECSSLKSTRFGTSTRKSNEGTGKGISAGEPYRLTGPRCLFDEEIFQRYCMASSWIEPKDRAYGKLLEGVRSCNKALIRHYGEEYLIDDSILGRVVDCGGECASIIVDICRLSAKSYSLVNIALEKGRVDVLKHLVEEHRDFMLTCLDKKLNELKDGLPRAVADIKLLRVAGLENQKKLDNMLYLCIYTPDPSIVKKFISAGAEPDRLHIELVIKTGNLDFLDAHITEANIERIIKFVKAELRRVEGVMVERVILERERVERALDFLRRKKVRQNIKKILHKSGTIGSLSKRGKEGKVGSMVWAEAQGKYYRRNGLPEKLRTFRGCMNANFNTSRGVLPRYVQYGKTHIYFIAKGLGLPVTRDMTKGELCAMLQHGQREEFNRKYRQSKQFESERQRRERLRRMEQEYQPGEPYRQTGPRGLFDEDE